MPINTEQQPIAWKRLLIFSGLFVLLTALGFYSIQQFFQGAELRFDNRLLNPSILLSVLALLIVYFASDGLRLYFTLRALGYRVPAAAMSRLVFINLFFSNVTPMATGGGFAQVWYLAKQGVPVGRATAATTIRTVLAVIFIFTLTPILLLTLPALSDSALSKGIGGSLAVLVTAYLAFFAMVLFKTHWLIAPINGTLKLLERLNLVSQHRCRVLGFWSKREMLRFADSFRDYCKGPPLFFWGSVLFTVIFLLSLFSFPAILLWALDYSVPYWQSVGLLVVTTFVMYFAPTPGASGVSEGVFGSFFAQFVQSNHLLLIIFSWRFITIYLGMLIGMVTLQYEMLASRRKGA
ncbi:hypothetical protein DFP83_11360 [Idiomarina fontislapidosi]|uniref:TIGR00374 family protein n=1 Tax=Idiomarina fontislapidosi TaxID=263723 RepID=A0A432XRA8_9GAMM|nr:lysylphosphatidylglycerol synthase transmembrane domain-containing protein [Idiomarina fontislapidosi]PYE30862.1 hypothetical protein DFP83_11360 [Idiomarina fontislapidosi]RUO51224.1 TIGR00374 family protein [Idiomarina fontislapidosi]